VVCQSSDAAWEICYPNGLGLSSVSLAHDFRPVSLLGFSVWSGIGANCDECRKYRKAMQILEQFNSRFWGKWYTKMLLCGEIKIFTYFFNVVPMARFWISQVSAFFQYLNGVYKKAGEVLFTRVWSDRTRGNGFKLKEGRLRLGIRKKFFTMRVMKHWHSLSREAVAAPSLAVFKARFDRALSNLI